MKPDTTLAQKVLDVLNSARDRVANGWTQGVNARTAKGVRTNSLDPEATCFCSLGAVVSTQAEPKLLGGAVSALMAEVPAAYDCGGAKINTVVKFNDDPETTHKDVMALFDRAIAKAKELERETL